MKRFLVACIFFILFNNTWSQEPFIQFNKPLYQQGDTIAINCTLDKYSKDSIHFASLYLFIEKLNTKQNWIYRYPIIDGISEASLIIDHSLSDGKYAFAFQVRKSFFNIQGMAENGDDMDLNYSMFTKNNNSIINKVHTNAIGNFSLRGILFEDTCQFTFYPSKPRNGDPVKIGIITSLDSAFVSEYDYTRIISVGNTETVLPADTNYQVDISGMMGRTSLPDVIVKAIRKKKIEQFNDEFSTGLFKNGDARVFDGLENNQIAESVSILNFLQGRVAGLTILNRNGNYILQWRGLTNFRGGSGVDVFIDEMKIDQISDNMINPSDVAMIKAFPPPAFLSAGGQKGAIAIYTKRGEFQPDVPNRNKFRVFGYSAMEMVWK